MNMSALAQAFSLVQTEFQFIGYTTCILEVVFVNIVRRPVSVIKYNILALDFLSMRLSVDVMK